MKTLRLLAIMLTLLSGFLPFAKGQTLAEVLCAVQRRNQLLLEENNVYNSGYMSVLPLDWGSVSQYPTEEEVEALPISDRVHLLKKAWDQVNAYTYHASPLWFTRSPDLWSPYYSPYFLDSRKFSSGVGTIALFSKIDRRERITPENFNAQIHVLAQNILHWNTIFWPLNSKLITTEAWQPDLKSSPSTPLLAFNDNLISYGPSDNFSIVKQAQISFSLTLARSGAPDQRPDFDEDFNDISYTDTSLSGTAPPSFSGNFEIYSNACYFVNCITGLNWPLESGGDGDSLTLYHPGDQMWKSISVEKGGSVDLGDPPGVFGGNMSGLGFPGAWDQIGSDFVPTFQNQNNPTLWASYFNWRDPDFGGIDYSPLDQQHYQDPIYQQEWLSQSVFIADFGNEYASQSSPPPEKAMPLEIIQDLANTIIKVRLANDPQNDCELVWNLNTNGVSMRKNLDVRGSGQWDAVYSGKPADREPEIQWQNGRYDQNGRWPTFDDYLSDWWQPVLKQLKTATYGVDITQEGNYGYKIDFYLASQVGAKNAYGTYTFNGSPVETFYVENPNQDDSQAGDMEITTTNAVYHLSTTLTYDDTGETELSWACTFSVHDGNTDVILLSKNVSVTLQGQYKVEDETSVDSIALPKITTTYNTTVLSGAADPQEIDKIIEEGEEGTRTTTFNYTTDDSVTGYHLTGITQTGGLNPYTATYDSNELLTDYTCGSSEIQIGYNGSTVTRTEKLGGATVRTSETTYSGDMTQATTTVDGLQDGASSIVKYYPGDDSINPWGLKSIREFDGLLTTYTYSWSGSNFVTETKSGGTSSGSPDTVTQGSKTTTSINPAGRVFSTETYDIESGLKVDFKTADANASTLPTHFNCPLGTGESYSYDSLGRVASYTDRLGHESDYTLDALGRTTKVVRGALTWNVAYNPGHLGSMTTCGDRSQEESTSPFGGDQWIEISGPEEITVTREETADSITTETDNSTTSQTQTEVVQKSDFARAITGNATEPWNITCGVTGGSLVSTITHGDASSLTATSKYDALGRVTQETGPSASGAGTASTSYAYVAGRLDSKTDPLGTTNYQYRPDGVVSSVSRGGRFMTVSRVSSDSQIEWECRNALNETLWQSAWAPATGAVQYIPWGDSTKAVTTTPTYYGDMLTLNSTAAGMSQVTNLQDGALKSGSSQIRNEISSWSAVINDFNEATSVTATNGTGGTITTAISALGLPGGVTGSLMSGSYGNTFSADGFVSTFTRNEKTISGSYSAKGDFLGEQGYGKPDQTWSAPSIGSVVTKTLSTGAGNAQFKWSLGGTLLQRKFPDGTGETFAYNTGGALTNWTTPTASLDFSPNAFGEPEHISSGGDDLADITYDNAGRMSAISDHGGTRTFTYAEGQVALVSYTAGVLQGQSVNHIHTYDSSGRRVETVSLPGSHTVTYTYGGDNGELSNVTTFGGEPGTWGNYDAVTGRPKTFSLGALTTSGSYDGLGRVRRQTSTTGTMGTITYTADYDANGHCNARTTPHGSWGYDYDVTTGYLQSATSSWKNYSYAFDEAGRPVGASDYRPTVRANGSKVVVEGSVTPSATVTINGAAVTVNAAGIFSGTYTPTPNTWQAYLVQGKLAGAGPGGSDATAVELRNVFLPPASESLGYNSGGDRTGEAKWSYTWNALDQMTEAQEINPPPGSPPRFIDFLYDYEGHRLEKKIRHGSDPVKRTTTVWDSWRPLLDVDYNAGTEVARRYYTWGPDVSGSLNGAAGIGGLIEIAELKGSTVTRSLPIYDGIGHVMGLVDAATGVRVATYEYGPFGEIIAMYGPRAASCPFLFSTKRYDAETGLYYFGKRYYDAKTQTWISRDPLREAGGVNLYAYCNNDPVGNVDAIGLDDSMFDSIWNGFFDWMDSKRGPARAHQAIQEGIFGGKDAYQNKLKEWQITTRDPAGDYFRRANHAADYGEEFDADGFIRNYQSANSRLRDYVGTRNTIEEAPVDLTVLLLSLYGPGIASKAIGLVGDGFAAIRFGLQGTETASQGIMLQSRFASEVGVVDVFSGAVSKASVPTVDRIRSVAQRGFDYAVKNPTIAGLTRSQLGTQADIQASRWLRRWAESNDIMMGQGGLRLQVEGAHSVPDIIFDPSNQIFDFKLTPKAIRPSQARNFINDFPGYDIEYIFGPGPWR